MNRRNVGRTGLAVTELGFGAAGIGGLYRPVSAEQAHATVDAAWQAGVRYFDTAPHYGLGLSERRLGAALKDRPRHEYVVSTKGSWLARRARSGHRLDAARAAGLTAGRQGRELFPARRPGQGVPAGTLICAGAGRSS